MKRIIGLMFAGMLVLNSVFADGLSIAVVDLQKIMQTSPQMKAIQEKLESEYKPRRDALVKQEEAMKQQMEKFKRDAAVMTQSQKKELETKIIGMQRQFEKEGQKYQQELNAAHNAAMESYYNKIRGVISDIAAQDHYDLVLQKDAAPFSKDKLDITTKVMKDVK